MFKSDLTDIGNIEPGSEVQVEWELVDPSTEIVHYQPDCGCTAKSRKEGSKVVATFTEQDVAKLSSEQKKNWYPSGKVPITKGIWVYFKDDKDLYIIQNGRQIINPEKSKMKLTFIGYAVLPEEELV